MQVASVPFFATHTSNAKKGAFFMEKAHVLKAGGLEVSVSKEAYSAYKLSVWSERNKNRFRLKAETSLDQILETGMEFASSEMSAEEAACRKILMETVTAALLSLAEDERKLITAIFFEEKSLRDIAENLGISHVAVHKRKNNILKKLRGIIG
ncbi:sigma-70 family RNA polymerase sigma factor [Eubacteriales bacterium OttesenSCG-928-A19]|nr:sigma-70 family RNA polymerase sigma factor [Eubacteriales bacterium OttesenSCG-928-A19]